MTLLTDFGLVVPPLAPVSAALDAMRARHGASAVHGLARDLVVTDPVGWSPATSLVNGDELPALLDAAKRRWGASPHAAAALAWKSYTYWLALPAILGWASARRVPLLDPANVLVRFTDHQPFLTLGLRHVGVTVLPADPILATPVARAADLRIAATEADLLATLRRSLLDAHLMPLLDSIREHTHLGQRTLLGSLASGVAYGIIRASDTLPCSTTGTIRALLETLDVADLVELETGPTGELSVHRRTCCLAFTLAEPKICGSCCIRDA